MKINSIQFFDYRAFFNGQNDKYRLIIDGKNLLIYGENGSGKTSFYRGLKDFFHGEDFVVHNQTPRLNEGFIEIVFSDGTSERLEASGLNPIKAEVLSTRKLNSFISYKELLKTHLQEENKINFFKPIVNDILGEHLLETFGPLKIAWSNEIAKDLVAEKQSIDEAVSKGEISEETALEQKEKIEQDFLDSKSKFEDELKLLLTQINNKLTELLTYFNQNLEVKLDLESLDWNNPYQSLIKLDVKLFGNNIDSHHNFLNEARLSAIAISIYLTAIKLNPTQNAVKLLCLDDIFLGLDLGNRIPLLKILRIEFKDWQIIMTTFDRHWFEVAKYELNDIIWLTVEFYSIYDDDKGFEIPLLYSPSLDYLQKAEFYYRKGNLDYPASGNYLRKEFERILKNILYGKYLLQANGNTGEIKEISELGDLWSRFCTSQNSLLKALNLEVSEYNEFDIVSKTVLNPLSHDNLNKAIYKGELELAFKLLEKLSAVEKILLITLGDELKIETNNSGLRRITYVKLSTNVLGYKQVFENPDTTLTEKVAIPEFKVKPIKYTQRGSDTSLSHLQECSIEKAFDMVYHDVYGIVNGSKLRGLNLKDEFVHIDSGLTLHVIFSSF